MNIAVSFGLTDQVIQKINSIFQKHTNIEKVVLYGSRAMGNFKPGSDIDLMVVGPDLMTSDLLKLENELDDLLLPYKIDLSLHHKIENKNLLDHVSRVGTLFFERDSQ